MLGLKETYKSLLSQTYHDYEWIVIDGDSSDGTKNWLRNVLKNTCKWISEPDSGIYEGMNKGLHIASGEYLIFMNSGDEFAKPDILEKVAIIINELNEKSSLIYGDSIDFKNNKEYYRKAKPRTTLWKCMFTQHQSMFFRNSLIGNLKYNNNFKYSGDYAFVIEYIQRAKNNEVVKVDFPICKYILGGVNEQNRPKGIKEDYVIRKEILRQKLVTRIILFFLHSLHFYLKSMFSEKMIKLRYSRLWQ